MDLSTTNAWLALIGVVSLLQLAALGVACYVLITQARRASAALETIVTDARPLLRQTSAVLEDVQDLASRVRRADASAHAAAEQVAETWTRAKSAAVSRLWPVLGLFNGIRAAASVLKSQPAPSRKARRLDETAEARFDYEGGDQPADGTAEVRRLSEKAQRARAISPASARGGNRV